MKTALSRPKKSVTASPQVTEELLLQAQYYLKHREKDAPASQLLEAAWNEFYDLCTRKIRSFAFAHGAVENEIHDCVQNVWTTLIARLPTFQLDPSRGQFESWLFRIVQSKTINLRRSRTRIRSHESAASLQKVADDHAAPGDRAEDQETAKLAWNLLEKRLSEPNLQILQLRLVQQLSGAQVAARLGITHEQVRYRYHRARRQLEAIGTAWSGDSSSLHANENSADKKIEKIKEPAQQNQAACVSRAVNPSSPTLSGGHCLDYVFQRLELGRRDLTAEWKIEWNCDSVPTPVLYIRKSAIVAYAEICGCEEFINTNWPRIVNAAVAAGVAAGIATPTAALPIFRAEFCRHLKETTAGRDQESVQVALSAKQEANGRWRMRQE